MELNYKVYGAGHPLIILHGLLGSLDNWHSIARQLSPDFRIYLLDQRNHGKSPHTDKMDYSTMAADIHAFMEQHALSSAYLAGHSMGGKTAMQLALNHPSVVDKLIAIDMPPQANSPGHEFIFRALKAMDLSRIKRRKDADEQLKASIDELGIRQFLLKNLERSPDNGYQWKMNLPAIEKAYSEIIKAVSANQPYTGPTLFIKGGRSDYLDEHKLSTYQTLFPKATLQTIKKAGHWVHAEAPKQFTKTLYEFLVEDE